MVLNKLNGESSNLAQKATGLASQGLGKIFDDSKFGFFNIGDRLGLKKPQSLMIMVTGIVFILNKFFNQDGIVIDHMDVYLSTDYVNQVCEQEVLQQGDQAIFSIYALRLYMMFLGVVQISIPLLTSFIVRHSPMDKYAKRIFSLYDEVIEAIGKKNIETQQCKWAQIEQSTKLDCTKEIGDKIDAIKKSLNDATYLNRSKRCNALGTTGPMFMIFISTVVICATMSPFMLFNRTFPFFSTKELPVCVVEVPTLNLRSPQFRAKQSMITEDDVTATANNNISDVMGSDKLFSHHTGRIRTVGEVKIPRLNLTVKEHGQASHYWEGDLTQVYQVRVLIKRLYVKLLIIVVSVALTISQSIFSIISLLELIKHGNDPDSFARRFHIKKLLQKTFRINDDEEEQEEEED